MSEQASSGQNSDGGAIYRVGVPFLILGLVIGALGGALLPELLNRPPEVPKRTSDSDGTNSAPRVAGEPLSVQALTEDAQRAGLTLEEYIEREGIDPATIEGYVPPVNGAGDGDEGENPTDGEG